MAPPPKHAGLRLPFISITLGRGEGLPPLIAGIATFFSLLIITSILSRSYCSEKRDCLTIAPLKIEIPTGVWGSIAGAFSGAIFTYGVFNLLEIQKAKREPKPHLRPSFDSCDEDCLVVDSHPHPIFLPSRDSQHAAKQFVGSASYLRSLQKNRLNRRVSPSSGGLVGLSWRCQGLRWPDDCDSGPLELSGAHRLPTPLGNLLLMPSPSPV